MDKRIIKTASIGVGIIGVIVLLVLLNKKVINAITFIIIAGALLVVVIGIYVLLYYLKNLSHQEIKTEEYNQDEIMEKIRMFLMYHKFIQPVMESEEIKFITLNKDLNVVYFCEDDSTPRQYYVLYNLKTKLFNIFTSKIEIEKHINNLIKQQYVIKQKVMGRNVFTGEEREAEEMIDKDELDELKKLKEERDSRETLN